MKANVKPLHNDPYDRLTAQNQVYAEGNRRRDNIHNMISASLEALELNLADKDSDWSHESRFKANVERLTRAAEPFVRFTDMDYRSDSKETFLNNFAEMIRNMQEVYEKEKVR